MGNWAGSGERATRSKSSTERMGRPAIEVMTSQLQAATQELVRDLDSPHVDEARALAQAEKVMGLESVVKKTHLGLLIRIKNLLSDGQRAKLDQLRRRGAN